LSRRAGAIRYHGPVKRWAAAALLAFLLPAPGNAAGVPPLSPPPRLVLVLSVDQMRFDYLTRFEPLFREGFRMLWDRGAIFRNAHQNYANSETAPGHSVILSGRYPSHSGIIANEWWDSVSRTWTNVVDDPAHVAVGGTGRGASPANLLGFTVGDVLKKKSPASKVVGVSLKDRSAVLLAGRRGDAAYWYESAHGGFITSTYYASAAPEWLLAFNRRHYPDRYVGQSWTRLLPDEAVYLRYAGADALAGEFDNKDTTFPHVLRGPPSPAFYESFRRTPFADEMTLAVAFEAMGAHGLGTDEATDILAVSFSATDAIGHTFGAGSQEAMDQMLRLDQTVGRLFAEAERRAGPGRTLVVLSADHGSMPLAETLRARGIDARRADPALLEQAVQAALLDRFGGAEGIVAKSDPPNVYLDLDRIRERGLRRTDVEATIAKALLGTGLVQAVYTQEALLGDASDKDPYVRLFRNSFFQPRSPHIMPLLKENVYLDERPGGTGHGTAHEYDRHVPVVFMGPGIVPGTHDAPVGPEHIAATLGALLGLDYPLQDADRLLWEVVTPAAPAQ
jgi:predicted AlkP superfamily pyrophosphatase or phosphodiesterase